MLCPYTSRFIIYVQRSLERKKNGVRVAAAGQIMTCTASMATSVFLCDIPELCAGPAGIYGIGPAGRQSVEEVGLDMYRLKDRPRLAWWGIRFIYNSKRGQRTCRAS